MRRVIIACLLLLLVMVPVSAAQLQPPEVPDSGEAFFPEEPENFTQGLLDLLRDALKQFQPEIAGAAVVCAKVMAICLLVGILRNLPGSDIRIMDIVSTAAIAAILLQQSNTLVHLGTETVTQLSDYGKLLLPVMTAALAAQGGTTSSAALYTGTAVFDAVLCTAISRLIVPMVYVFICLSVANSALGEEILGKLRDFVKWIMTWCLKIVLYSFVGYISVTGVVSGSADAAAIKAAKITINGVVPVVGGILSDASEAILVGAGVVKNSVGVYGLLAMLAVWIGPFLKIGAQYLTLKLTAAVCGVISAKQTSALIKDFSSAMGLLLAMTGTVCLLLLISTVAFMKGAGQ